VYRISWVSWVSPSGMTHADPENNIEKIIPLRTLGRLKCSRLKNIYPLLLQWLLWRG
jgi:hypothetical protein